MKKNVSGSEVAFTKQLVLKTPVPKTLAVFVTVVCSTSSLTKATVLQTPALHLEHNVHEQCFLISSKALSRFADFWVLQYEGGFEPQHPHDFKHCARNKVIQTASLSAVPLAMYYAADKVETDQKIQVRCGRQGRD